MVLMPLPLYQKMVRTHTGKDQVVDWQRLEAQRQIRSHTRGMAKVFKVGSNKGERIQARCHRNLSSWACDPPILRATVKTHKDVDGEGLSKSRPIVGGGRGLTTPLGETLSDLLDPVENARPQQWKAQSMEEVLKMIQETNTKLEEGRVCDCGRLS